ncbi:hypothetical protein TBR22_A35420 [Luteitalea sp. TBR-22]|uniref:BPSS1780 family membrane protein n=1 Tax=Luteitalea sp. TBR-22 TaxID=2802971 RepID=UPI001AF9F1B3|nr:BPSS1780 family membrane protein [Luteitalea sp. TBR-22]BCS34312.1 hypothetical protein TBR22_A35420 [Luteitalea sp. TBR-22]
MEPRVVAARRGLDWLREGLDLFAMAPGTWLGITLLFSMMIVALSVIPFVGMLLSVAIPIFIGGLMLGCDAQRLGRPLEVRYLFNGFEAPRLQPLAVVGALYLAGSIVVMIPVIAVVVGTSVASAVAAVSASGAGSSSAGLGTLGLSAVLFGVGLLLVMAASILLSMTLWFAPALVVFRNIAPLEAMKASLRGALRNIGAFTIYTLSLLGVGLLVMLPLLAAILLAAARGTSGGDLTPMLAIAIGGASLFALICIVLLMPPMWGAMYASYRDVFGDAGNLEFDM